jgi:ABC-type transporter Mla subunit MlaD
MKVEQLRQIIDERDFEPEVKEPLEAKLQSYGEPQAEASSEQVQEFRELLLNLKQQKDEEAAKIEQLQQFVRDSAAELEQINAESDAELEQIDEQYGQQLEQINEEESQHLEQLQQKYAELIKQAEQTENQETPATPEPAAVSEATTPRN